MRDVSFGQYYPVKSVIHRCDPRTKLVVSIAYMVMLFFIPTLNKFTANGQSLSSYLMFIGACYTVALLFVLAAIILSRVPFLKVLKSLKALIFMIAFMFIISVLFYGGDVDYLFKWGIFKASKEGLVNAFSMSLRIIFLVLGPAIMTLTTTPVQLTDGLENLLTPLKWIRLPVHAFAMIMSIALRLVPTLTEETGKIINAQKARCADFDSKNIFKKAKSLMPILIPLFVSSFRRADELADAMDSRCYNGAKGRTRMKKLKFAFRDFVCFFVMGAVFYLILMLRFDWFNAQEWLLNLFNA